MTPIDSFDWSLLLKNSVICGFVLAGLLELLRLVRKR